MVRTSQLRIAVIVAAVSAALLSRLTRSGLVLVAAVAVIAVYYLATTRLRRTDGDAPADRLTIDMAAAPAPASLPAMAPPPPTPVATAPRPVAIAVDHLTKRFGERVAFEDVSFQVEAGEVFGFLGPNGAGKTTTVRTLGTLISPSAGSAIVAGIPLAPDNGEAIRQRIAIMPESPGLYLRLSIRENLEFFAGLFGIAAPRARIHEALEAVNMVARVDDICGTLSKGLRQRVGLARALLSNPEVVFLDEPTSGLDPVAAREVHELIDGLRRRGATVFLTTHRLEEAERLCDRVAILNTTLRVVGRPDELRARLFERTIGIALSAPLRDAGAVFGGITGVERWEVDARGGYLLTVTDPKTVAPAVTRALVAAGADVESIGESQRSLEDVYLELISDDVEAMPR